MSMAINMPLGGLIDKSLKGEAHFAHEEWLRTYVKRLTNGNKTKLKQALNEVDEAINQWRDGFFISTYDEKLSAIRQGKLNMNSQELEDIYNEETYLQKGGKIGLVADFLYNSIAQYGFINEHHRDAIESAWLFHDMEFLQQQWEIIPKCLILHFVVSLRTMQRTLFTSGPVPVKYLVIVPGQTGANSCSSVTKS